VVEGLNDATAAELQERTRALYVVRDAEFRLLEPAAVGQPELTDASMSEPLSSDDPTTALGYDDQWNMRQIHADQAWAAGRLGSSAVTVAILDTGIDYMLPDLVGLVDLDRSASFEPQDDAYAAAYFPSRHPSTDLHFHGTNVATQVASNAWAFAGVTSRTTLLSVKVCSFMGGCHGVYQGILWAIDHGADVINMSLGGWFVKAAYPGEVMAYNRLMNYAAQKGVTVVVAAGNDGDDLDRQDNILVDRDTGDRVHLPSFFNWFCEATQVICVSATRRDDEPASYTNYGSSAIDVAAPGGDFYSDGSGDWVYALCPQTSLIFPCADGYYPLGVAGTSQAAPHVAGLAALAVEDVGRAPARVKAYIRNSADPMGGIARPWFGRGRINVAKAVGAW
jgi:subtilisin family serine protease